MQSGKKRVDRDSGQRGKRDDRARLNVGGVSGLCRLGGQMERKDEIRQRGQKQRELFGQILIKVSKYCCTNKSILSYLCLSTDPVLTRHTVQELTCYLCDSSIKCRWNSLCSN